MKIIELGASGVDVYSLQQALKITADGVFGPVTLGAIREFQRKYGLTVDGRVGPITRAALFPTEARRDVQRGLEAGDKLSPFHKSFVEIALSLQHVREEGGQNKGLWVEKFQKAGGGMPGWAWCHYFVNYCSETSATLNNCADPLEPDTGSVIAAARQAKSRGWTRAKDDARRGDVFWMDYGNGSGHTGIVLSYANGMYQTIEGNTNAKGSPEGDGVYFKTRKYTEIAGVYRLPDPVT